MLCWLAASFLHHDELVEHAVPTCRHEMIKLEVVHHPPSKQKEQYYSSSSSASSSTSSSSSQPATNSRPSVKPVE